MTRWSDLPIRVRQRALDYIKGQAETLDAMAHPDDRALAEALRVLRESAAPKVRNVLEPDPGSELELRIHPWQALDAGQRAAFLNWLLDRAGPLTSRDWPPAWAAIHTLGNLEPAAVQSRAWPEGRPHVKSASAVAGDPTLAPPGED